MKWARIINNTAVEITDVNPAGRFAPEITWEPVPDTVTVNSTRTGETWAIAPEPAPAATGPEPAIPDITVSPVEFKLLWTSPERIAIKTLKSTDEVIADLFEIMDDPRLNTVNLSLKSTQDAVDYILAKLAGAGVVAASAVAGRRDEILSGAFR